MSDQAIRAVFLSHASQDAGAAQRIAAALQAAGIEVWFDQSALKGGAAWDAEIRRQIHDCALFVPIISANTEHRLEGYFRLEWRLAEQRTHQMAKGKPFLVPVAIDGTSDDSAHVPDAFLDVQWTRLPGGENAASFAGHVKELLTHTEVAATAHSHAHPASGSASPQRQRLIAWPVLAIVAGLLMGVAALWLYRGAKTGSVQSDGANRAATPEAAAQSMTAPAPRTAVAVMPFANRTGDASKDYLGEGLAEELINMLGKVPGLRVPARTSSFSYKGREATARQIAADLNIGSILEGSVRSAGNTLRITVQLVDAQTDTQLWSEVYERRMTDLFKLQSQLAADIVQALQPKFAGAAGTAIPQTAGTTDVEAYNLVMQGGTLLQTTRPERLTLALELFQKAIERDPKYARAWTGLSGVHYARSTALLSDEERAEAERTALHALALDNTGGDARVGLARIADTRGDFVESRGHWGAALAWAGTGSFLSSLYVSHLTSVGHLRDAVAEARKGYALAPANTFAVSRIAHAVSVAGLDSEAPRWVALARAMFGNDAGPGLLRLAEFRIALQEQRLDAATDLLAKVPARAEIDKASLQLIVAAMADPARRPAAVAVKSRFYPKAKAPKIGAAIPLRWVADSAGTCMAAYAYAVAGALDEAYDLADRCLPATIGVASGALWAPETAAFRSDPRFAGYAEHIGLKMIEYWQKYGPPDGCDLKGGKLTCR